MIRREFLLDPSRLFSLAARWCLAIVAGGSVAIAQSAGPAVVGFDYPTNEPLPGWTSFPVDEMPPDAPAAQEACNPPCLSTNMSFGCLSLLDGSLSGLDTGNVPMNRWYYNDYRGISWNSSQPVSGICYTKLGNPNSPSQLLLRADSWCCREIWGGPCLDCEPCAGRWTSEAPSWPASSSFQVPVIAPGWRQLSIGISQGAAAMDAVMINLTYPNATDLKPTNFALPAGSLVPGQPYQATVQIRNHGELPALWASAGLFMSDDATVTSADTLVAQYFYYDIPGGWSGSTSFPIPFTCPLGVSGTKYFAVNLSSGGDFDITNDWSASIQKDFRANLRFASPQLVTIDPVPDGTGVTKLVPGEPFTVQFTYENAGNGDSQPTTQVEIWSAGSPTAVGIRIAELALPNPIVPASSGPLTSDPYVVTLPLDASHAVGELRWIYAKLVNAGPESTVSDNISAPLSVTCAALVDLVLHLPRVIDDSAPARPDGQPSVTWMNLDNDDTDQFYDYDLQQSSSDPDGVAGGDDELVEMELRVKPKNIALHPAGAVTLLSMLQPQSFVRIWENNQKNGGHYEPYTPAPVALADFTIQGDWLKTSLWLEGVMAHDPQQALTKIKLDYGGGLNAREPDIEEIQVLAVKHVYWNARANGFSEPDHSGSTLLDDPNYPSVQLPSLLTLRNLRVVTGARQVDPHVSLDTVDLNVVLSAVPVSGVQISVYVRSFDVDDPNTNSTIDPNDAGTGGTYSGSTIAYTAEEDNRGTVNGLKSGWFDGQQPSHIALLNFSPGVATAEIAFTASRQPGDNYVAVVSPDSHYLSALTNKDGEDGMAVCDPYVKAGGNSGEVQQSLLQYMCTSEILTVWRVLHIEHDSMKQVPQPPVVRANCLIAPLASIKNSATELWFTSRISDLSDDLSSSPPQPGRFEHGSATLGGAGGLVFSPLVGNGGFFVRHTGTMNIPFTLSAPSQPVVVGTVSELMTNAFTLSTSGALTSQYLNGTLTVLGSAMTVTAVNPPVVTVASVNLVVELRDDDDESALPAHLPIDLLRDKLLPAYYHPQIDGGTSMANNTQDVPFYNNADGRTLESLRQQGTPLADESEMFWVGYLGSAYQSETHRDADPDSEFGRGGQTQMGLYSTNSVATGAQGCWVFVETCRDRLIQVVPPAAPGLVERVTAHEMGHQLGLDHEAGTIMNSSSQQVQPNPGFSDLYLNILRCRVNSPGT